MNVLKKLASDTAIYGLSSIIGRVLNYLLVPFYTSLLLPAEYGTITEFYAYVAFLSVIYAGGIETAYFRFATQGQPLEVFTTTSSLLLITGLGISSLIICLATPLINLLGYTGCENYIYYLAVILAVDNILLIPFAELRYNNKALRFALAKCLQISLNIILNLILLYIFPGIYLGKFLHRFMPFIRYLYNPTCHIEYVFLANLLANICVFPILTKTLLRFRFQLSWRKIQPIVAYAVPLLLVGLAGTTNEMLSRALLKHMLPVGYYMEQNNETILGIFGACYKLAIFMLLSIQAFRYAAEPFFFTHAQDKYAPQLFSKIMHSYILIACFIWFAISANLDLLGYLFLRQPIYRTSIEIVPYLCLAYVWLGIYYNLSVWFKIIDKTYYGSIITILGAVATILINLILMPYYGYWGSVWATVGSYFIMAALCYYLGQNHYPIPYKTAYGLLYIIGTLGLVVFVRGIHHTNCLHAFVNNIGLTVIYGLFVYMQLYRIHKTKQV